MTKQSNAIKSDKALTIASALQHMAQSGHREPKKHVGVAAKTSPKGDGLKTGQLWEAGFKAQAEVSQTIRQRLLSAAEQYAAQEQATEYLSGYAEGLKSIGTLRATTVGRMVSDARALFRAFSVDRDKLQEQSDYATTITVARKLAPARGKGAGSASGRKPRKLKTEQIAMMCKVLESRASWTQVLEVMERMGNMLETLFGGAVRFNIDGVGVIGPLGLVQTLRDRVVAEVAARGKAAERERSF